MDAQPAIQTDPNSGIPWIFTNMVDPVVYQILFSPKNASGSITLTGTFQQVFAASPTRTGCTIQNNDATHVMNVYAGP